MPFTLAGSVITQSGITMINGFNIDDIASEHLNDGSIIQDNGNTIYDGIVNFGNTSKINVMQSGDLITNDFWNSFSPVGFNADADQGISHRFLIKVRDGGIDIDGRRLLGMSRQPGQTWSEFPINGTSRGNNVLALSESDDLNNVTDELEIASWNDIVNDIEGYAPVDADGDGTNEFYISNWELGTRSKNDLYERAKYLAQDGTEETLYGLSGDIFRGITHEIALTGVAGDYVEPEAVSWTGGTGQLLAINDDSDRMWIQLLTGSAPVDGQTVTGVSSGATADVNVEVLSRPVAVPFIGASTGSAIIGSYGFGIGADDLSSDDRLTDLTDTLRVPPNNVSFTVSGLVAGEDRIFVGPSLGGALDKSQMLLASALDAVVTTIEVSAPIPTDTPASGIIRVVDDEDLEHQLEYSSYSGSTFEITTTDANADFSTVGAASENGVYVAYIDKLSESASEKFTSVYSADRPLFVRVRDGKDTPIKTFETTATLGAGGGSTTIIRTGDQ